MPCNESVPVSAEDAQRRIVAKLLTECVFYRGSASGLGGDVCNGVPSTMSRWGRPWFTESKIDGVIHLQVGSQELVLGPLDG
jgi:hypothetical protein